MKKILIKILILLQIYLIMSKNLIRKKQNENDSNKKKSFFIKIVIILSAIIAVILIVIIIIYFILKWKEKKEFNLNIDENENLINKKIFLLKKEFKLIHYSNEIKTKKCPICVENFKLESKIILTTCNHIFHYKCLKKFVLENKIILCPLCKFDFMSLFENKNKDFNNVSLNFNDENESVFN